MRNTAVLQLAVLGLTVLAAGPACAQADYPNRRIELVIPFPPGGPTDVAARLVNQPFSAALGVPVVAVNKGGAGGAVGADYALKAPRDGYTLFFTTNTVLTILPVMQPGEAKHQPGDFTAVASTMVDYGSIAARSDAPFKTLDDLIAYARKNPGKVSYGSAGVGTLSSFAMEILKTSKKLDIVHVPFQGSGPLRTAILGGHIQLVSGGFSTWGPLIKAGDIRPMFTTAPKRLPTFPDVPTATEKGLADATINLWSLLTAPAGLSRPAIDKLAAAIEKSMKDPAVIAAVGKAGMIVDYHGPDATQKLLDTERQLVVSAVQKLGLAKK